MHHGINIASLLPSQVEDGATAAAAAKHFGDNVPSRLGDGSDVLSLGV